MFRPHLFLRVAALCLMGSGLLLAPSLVHTQEPTPADATDSLLDVGTTQPVPDIAVSPFDPLVEPVSPDEPADLPLLDPSPSLPTTDPVPGDAIPVPSVSSDGPAPRKPPAIQRRPESAPRPPRAAGSPYRPTMQPAAATPQRQQFQVARLKHALASDVEELLRKLYPINASASVAADVRTNSLLLRGEQRLIDEFLSIVENLDRPSEQRKQKPIPRRTTSRFRNSSADQLEQEFRELEAKAETIANDYRQAKNDRSRRNALRDELESVVALAFETRQSLQRAQVERLRSKLNRVEDQIHARESVKDRIMNRRVDQLIAEADLRWNPQLDLDHGSLSPKSVAPGNTPQLRPGMALKQGQSNPLRATVLGYGEDGKVKDVLLTPPKTRHALLFFHADWCPTCQVVRKQLKPHINDGLPIIEVDFDDNRRLADSFSVTRVPCYVLISDGQVRQKTMGTEFNPIVSKLKGLVRREPGNGQYPQDRLP